MILGLFDLRKNKKKKNLIELPQLVFENLREGKSYEMTLPTNIDGITKWYPVIGLRFEGDVCEIKDIVVV